MEHFIRVTDYEVRRISPPVELLPKSREEYEKGQKANGVVAS